MALGSWAAPAEALDQQGRNGGQLSFPRRAGPSSQRSLGIVSQVTTGYNFGTLVSQAVRPPPLTTTKSIVAQRSIFVLLVLFLKKSSFSWIFSEPTAVFPFFHQSVHMPLAAGVGLGQASLLSFQRLIAELLPGPATDQAIKYYLLSPSASSLNLVGMKSSERVGGDRKQTQVPRAHHVAEIS